MRSFIINNIPYLQRISVMTQLAVLLSTPDYGKVYKLVLSNPTAKIW